MMIPISIVSKFLVITILSCGNPEKLDIAGCKSELNELKKNIKLAKKDYRDLVDSSIKMVFDHKNIIEKRREKIGKDLAALETIEDKNNRLLTSFDNYDQKFEELAPKCSENRLPTCKDSVECLSPLLGNLSFHIQDLKKLREELDKLNQDLRLLGKYKQDEIPDTKPTDSVVTDQIPVNDHDKIDIGALKSGYGTSTHEAPPYSYFIVDLKEKDKNLQFFLKNPEGYPYRNIYNLNVDLAKYRRTDLLFAMNGGMFMPNGMPQGLYVENSNTIRPLDEREEIPNEFLNFYLQPNGVFLIEKSKVARVVVTEEYEKYRAQTAYATQSGPMLLIDGAINSKFNAKSNSRFVRNGVGILPDNRIIFIISDDTITFYDFALLFKNFGCKNALYLDGAISRMYVPGKRDDYEMQGNLGPIIGLTRKKQ
jgi:uncharacterized protein YigE (DUF2233 family)